MRVFYLLTAVIFCLSANAQDHLQLVSAVGGNFIGSSTTLSFSVGEVAIETFSNNQNTVNQGFFQHFDFVSASNENEFEQRLIVFPNPFNNELHLSVVGEQFAGRIEIILSNTLGQILYESTIDATSLDNYTINTSTWSSGIYLLTIISDKRTLKYTYKTTKQS